MKTVKSLEDSGLLLKGVSETIQNDTKAQKGGFLGIKEYISWNKCINRVGDGIIRANCGSKGFSKNKDF